MFIKNSNMGSFSLRIEQFVNDNCFLISEYANKSKMVDDILRHLASFLEEYSSLYQTLQNSNEAPANNFDLYSHVWSSLEKFDPDQIILQILLPINQTLAREIISEKGQKTFQEAFDVDNLFYSQIVRILVDELTTSRSEPERE